MTDKDTYSEIRSVLERFFRALDTGNLALMKKLLPDEKKMIHIGTDKGETWKGYDELVEATEEQFENLEYYRAEIRDLTVNTSQSKDIAWYFHLLNAEIKSGEKNYSWEGARFTGVLEKRGGDWVMMQTHVSIPETG